MPSFSVVAKLIIVVVIRLILLNYTCTCLLELLARQLTNVADLIVFLLADAAHAEEACRQRYTWAALSAGVSNCHCLLA